LSEEKIMAEKTAVIPAQAYDKKRLTLLSKMPTQLREVAEDFSNRLARGNLGLVVILYDMGERLKEVTAKEAEYGSGAMKMLADFLGFDEKKGVTTLYNWRNFATEFTKEFVKEWTVKPMRDGRFLDLAHWLQLMKIKDKTDQVKMLNRVISHSLSANDLEKEIKAGMVKSKHSRQGGRKPGRPTSPIAGLQSAFQIGQKFNNYVPVVEKNILDVIDEMSPDDISDNLLENLNKARTEVAETEENAHNLGERLETTINRCEKVLTTRKDAGEAAPDEDEEEKPKKKVKKAKKEPSSNGATETKPKKKTRKKVKESTETSA
jgi:hypothetical protein